MTLLPAIFEPCGVVRDELDYDRSNIAIAAQEDLQIDRDHGLIGDAGL